MVDRACSKLSIARQCGLLGISRSSFYYEPCGESAENLALMRRIDELFLPNGHKWSARFSAPGKWHEH